MDGAPTSQLVVTGRFDYPNQCNKSPASAEDFCGSMCMRQMNAHGKRCAIFPR